MVRGLQKASATVRHISANGATSACSPKIYEINENRSMGMRRIIASRGTEIALSPTISMHESPT